MGISVFLYLNSSYISSITWDWTALCYNDESFDVRNGNTIWKVI